MYTLEVEGNVKLESPLADGQFGAPSGGTLYWSSHISPVTLDTRCVFTSVGAILKRLHFVLYYVFILYSELVYYCSTISL